MANTLNAAVTKFTTRLDKVIETATVTSDLNINGDLVGEVTNAGEVKIAKLAMQGLANYNRESGFTAGDVTLDWETLKLAYDRGREFSIDVLDDEERMLIVSANVMAEFARAKVVPEVDAIRFARLYEKGKQVTAEITTPEAALDAVLAAEEHMEGLGAELGQCVLYVSPKMKTMLRKAQSWRISNGEGSVSTDIQLFDGMKMRTVPTGRFFTKIDLKNDAEGGFAKASVSGFGLDFMVVHPSAAQAIQKHEKLRYFAPDVNQAKDAHKWQYRLHHDLVVFENRKELIYSSTPGK